MLPSISYASSWDRGLDTLKTWSAQAALPEATSLNRAESSRKDFELRSSRSLIVYMGTCANEGCSILSGFATTKRNQLANSSDLKKGSAGCRDNNLF